MRKKPAPKVPRQRSIIGLPVTDTSATSPVASKGQPNKLYYGDNLDILRKFIEDESVDLCYIDPPFNSKRNYNILFENIDIKDANAQKQAFSDTWSNYTYMETLNQLAPLHKDLYDLLSLYHKLKSISDSAVAYLTTMSIRIYYIHKSLKKSGSFYLHCDPTMSHYLKLVCDMIFGIKNFRNEITWKRSSAHSDGKQGRKGYGNISDVILFYSKTDNYVFNSQYLRYSEEYINAFYCHIDEKGRRYRLDNLTAAKGGGDTSYDFYGTKPYKGRFWAYSKANMEKFKTEGRLYFPKNNGTPSFKRYLDEMPGVPAQNLWDDIKPLTGGENERLGYPTQKPEALLERIIKSSSNEGDVVADFFCGCGTTIAVAQKLNRNWIGADISHLATRLIEKRLVDSYGKSIKTQIEVDGLPQDIGSAKELATNPNGGRISFQDWAIEVMLHGVSNPKKTADGGYDGYLAFDSNEGKQFALIETKSGHVNVKNMREFVDVVTSQKAAMGIFVCFAEQVTREMVKKAKDSGPIRVGDVEFPQDKIQIITVEDLLDHKQPQLPFNAVNKTFKKATRKQTKSGQQKIEFEKDLSILLFPE